MIGTTNIRLRVNIKLPNSFNDFKVHLTVVELLPLQRNLTLLVNPTTYSTFFGPRTGIGLASQDILLNNNITSTLYSFFGLTKGFIGVGYKVGYDLNFGADPVNKELYSSKLIPYPATISAQAAQNGF